MSDLRSLGFAISMFVASLAAPAAATAIMNDSYCRKDGLPPSLRQTVIVIDARVITPETDDPLPENKAWRDFAIRFVNPEDSFARESMDAREPVSIAVASADGSGLAEIFSGCFPTYRAEEAAARDAETSGVATFFGNDWRSQNEKDQDRFRRDVLLALADAARSLAPPDTSTTSPTDSSLFRSLAISRGYTLDAGLPRLVIYTDLEMATLPDLSVPDLRRTAEKDAAILGFDFQRAEVHLLGADGRDARAKPYFERLFLAGRGDLRTIAAVGGSLALQAPPRRVDIFQGTVELSNTVTYPLRIRLATDLNNTVVFSWAEMQAQQLRFTPFAGNLTCATADSCNFVGDGIFARVWDVDPGAEKPDCSAMPFGGLTRLTFLIEGETMAGTIADNFCVYQERDLGINFNLQRVMNGRF